MSDFKAKMHQIRFLLGLRPRPRWGNLQRSPTYSAPSDPIAVFKEPTSKWKEGKGEGKGRGGEQSDGKGEGAQGRKARGGGERKGRVRDGNEGVRLTHFLFEPRQLCMLNSINCIS